MNGNHLSAFEQEEYLLGQPTPEMLRHLANCDPCRAAVTQVQQQLTAFRSAAVDYSEASACTRAWRLPAKTTFLPITALRWAFAGVLPVLLAVLALFAFHVPSHHVTAPQAAISDDALLEQVDDQLSVSVPSSMESLTHLVSADDRPAGRAQSGSRSKTFAETN